MNSVNIIYEDNHIIVVEKPINVPVQEDESKDEDLLNIIKKYLKKKYSKEGNVYLGLVHRLDRPVGGIMIFAKTSKAASRLSEQIRKGEIQKKYLAAVHGKFEKEKGVLENYLYKDEKEIMSKVVEKDIKDSKYAKLEYEVIQYLKKEDLSLIKVLLYTGRHHQIRVQLANIGHSLYGDQKYGKADKKQIALWSYSLEFIHPVKKERMRFEISPFKNENTIWERFDMRL